MSRHSLGALWLLVNSLCANAFLSFVIRSPPLRLLSSVGDVDQVVATPSISKFIAVFNPSSLNITASNSFGPTVSSTEEAKGELLQLVANVVEDDMSRCRIDYLVKYLEATHTPIRTSQFLSLAVGGGWRFHYSNALLPRADPTIDCDIVQEIYPATNHTSGAICNKIQWQLNRPQDDGRGLLIVNSAYQVQQPKGALSLSLLEHVLDIEKLPLDAEQVIMDLQRTIPFQFFDPDATSVHTSYVDPDLRVARVTGKIFANLYEVHVRVRSSDVEQPKIDTVRRQTV